MASSDDVMASSDDVMASSDDVMASSDDVTVSVMMKTEDEGDLDDPNKNQEVILQLQPIRNECEAETDAAVMTVEAHADGEEVEIGYPITCGDSKALLLAKKFVCPGINVKCVKYEDQLISPKQFVHMSGKATLKDWKRAIRMGGVMLRKMMDSGQLDFYHHTALCTNTCRSTKFDLLINNTRFPPDGSGLTTPTSCQGTLGDGAQTDGQTYAGTMEWSSTAPLEAAEKKDTCEISEETLNFWKGIADVGLMGEVVTNISTELLQLLSGVQLRSQMSANPAPQDSDCLVEVAVLSNLAQVFGLLDSVKKILERRKLQVNPGQEHMLNTLNNLADQLEEQKRQQQVKSVSSPPSVKQTKPPPKRPTKRPRLQRPASTTTLLSSSSAGHQVALQQQQQFTVLSPISLSSMTGQTFTSMGQSFTVSGLPLGGGNNTVTLLPAGSQVITLHPSSGLTLVDPSQLGAMMGSTMELHNGAMMGSTMELHNGAMMGSTMELLQLSQQPEGSDESHVEEQVVLHQEVEEGQETTVIQIDPASTEEGEEHHSMLLQQEAIEETNMEDNNMEALVQEEEVQQEVKEEQTEEEEEEQS